MGIGEAHRWQIIGDLLVSFTSSGVISDETWGQFAADIRNPQVTRLLSSTMGDIDVTSTQRKLAADSARTRKMPVAVVADSKVVRGMVTAVSWLGVDIKSFGWDELPQAMTFLKVSSATEKRAIEVVRRFRVESL
jgi:hypothetical protein